MELFLFVALLIGIVAGQCPAQTPVSGHCPATTFVVFDATAYVQNEDLVKETNFIWNHMLPQIPLTSEQSAVFMTYGTSDQFNSVTNHYSSLCQSLFYSISSAKANGGHSTSIKEVFTSLWTNYNDYFTTGSSSIILFSASTNTSDIAEAYNFYALTMSYVPLTINTFTSTSYWNIFNTSTILNYTLDDLSSQVATEILCLSCSNCGLSTALPTSTWTDVPVVSTPSPVIDLLDGPPCVCNKETTWLDIIILIESTDAVGVTGLGDLLGYVQTILGWYTIETVDTAKEYHTRIGIITYASNATLVASLGSLDNDDLDNIDNLPFMGGIDTNLEDAFRLAAIEFDSDAHRPNARSVIALFASSYNPGGYHAPQQSANAFKGDNGILIVYEYVEQHGLSNGIIRNLASPGYYMSNDMPNDQTNMEKALCNANCYCPTNYEKFRQDSITKVPLAGCYFPHDIDGNFNVAKKQCNKFNDGYLAQGKTDEKTQFLQQIFAYNQNDFWAGMSWDPQLLKYLWMDGTLVDSPTYQPWSSVDHPSSSNTDLCVYVINSAGNLTWHQANCRNGYWYVCEAPPCDSGHYCTDVV